MAGPGRPGQRNRDPPVPRQSSARADRRGVDVGEIFHTVPGEGLVPGIDPERRSYFSRAVFSDPDGNEWQLQEITERLPGRG